ncbi:uncharacterized protein LOC125946198 [Dermacentor silvarum]|uniref:uncharacterized protein LOC125946198 n=1 Tax=Dermacentor silvarum TaxID=543639 RepID=UPI002100E03E|nr:uncharacterized protein LOC125946198 [Dermacentor silvarum]
MTASDILEVLKDTSLHVRMPTEHVTSSRHEVPTDATRTTGSTQSLTPNSPASQDVEHHDATNVPTQCSLNAEPSMAQILAALINTQVQLANALARGPPTTNPIHMHSLHERHFACNSNLRWGTPRKCSAMDCASGADGDARSVVFFAHAGERSEPTDGISQGLGIALTARATRPGRSGSTLSHTVQAEAHDAGVSQAAVITAPPEQGHHRVHVLEKRHTRQGAVLMPLRISPILSGINDNTWANPLPAQLCGSVTELIDRAALLDARRQLNVRAQNKRGRPPPSEAYREQRSDERCRSANDPTTPVPMQDTRRNDTRPPRPRTNYARSCFNCSDIGHLSHDCDKLKTPVTILANETRATRESKNSGTRSTSRQANCFLCSSGGTLPIVTGYIKSLRMHRQWCQCVSLEQVSSTCLPVPNEIYVPYAIHM